MKYRTIVILAFLCSGCSGLQVEPLLSASHISDITQSYPEPTEDYLGAGVTVSWRNIEVDVTHGIKSRDCGTFRGGECAWQSGSEISTRIYPLRRQ